MTPCRGTQWDTLSNDAWHIARLLERYENGFESSHGLGNTILSLADFAHQSCIERSKLLAIKQIFEIAISILEYSKGGRALTNEERTTMWEKLSVETDRPFGIVLG